MFKRFLTGAAFTLLSLASPAPAQLSTGYYGGGDYRTLYSFYPDRPVQWPGFYGYPLGPVVRKRAVCVPVTQDDAPQPLPAPVTIEMTLPEGAEVWIDGNKMSHTTTQRKFISPPLQPGRCFNYEFQIRFNEEGREQTMARSLDVFAGGHYTMDFVKRPITPERSEEIQAVRTKVEERLDKEE
jgi:uncharacterized protein (TIGR03000 family)